MLAINRKLLRDLSTMKGQGLAIGAVVACGIAVFVAALTILHSLDTAKNTYYAKNRFANVFATLVRAPNGIADRAANLPGVSTVDTRIVKPLTLDLPTMAGPRS